MRCEDVRERLEELWEGELPAEVRAHLAACPDCAESRREVRLIRAGFGLLAQDAAPEPSLGFAARLVRRLGERAEQRLREDSFAYVGRRFVYATLVLAMLLVAALLVPSTGPIRGQEVPDLLVAEQEEVTVRPDPVGSAWQDSSVVAPEPAGGNAKSQK